MVAEPADTPRTLPEVLTVATPVAEELHEPPLPDVLNVVFEPAHTDDEPLMVPALGNGLTVTACEAVLVPQVPVTE